MVRNNLLVGSILADAFSLGAHWIYSQRKIRENFGIYNEIHAPLEGSFHKNRTKGDHTHIGEQTLILLEYLSNNSDFKIEDFKKFWIEKLSNYDGYIDHATKDSLEAFKLGHQWGSLSTELAGASRMAPIIYCIPDRESGVKYAITQSKLTHNSHKSLLAAEFFSRVTYDVLEGIRPSEAISQTADSMNDSYLSDSILKAKEILSTSSDEAIKKLGQTCQMDDALPSTIYLILKYENNYKEAMIANVMAGGDSATRGLLTGMILGAYKRNSIPKEWINDMKTSERIHF